MATSTVNLQQVELVSTVRTAPQNGAPSSADYYDSELEKVTDLSTLALFINSTLLPIVNSLPANATTGLLGTSCYSDTENTDWLVYDSLDGNPLTLTQSLRLLSGQVQTIQTTMTNITQQVNSLQARLSASSQDDVSLALQGIVNSLAYNSSQISAITAALSNGNTSGVIIAVVPITSPSPCTSFAVAHGLSAPPLTAIICMTSSGTMWFQTPMFDATNLYLGASDVGITANVILFERPTV
jgi:hypothetical protein